MRDLKATNYAKNFAFLLKCKNCGRVCGELAGESYTAGKKLADIRQRGETCPYCNSCSWDMVRRIVVSE